MSNIIFVGTDDGHNNTCIVTSLGGRFHMASRAYIGKNKKFSIAGQEDKTFMYMSGDDMYTLGEIDKTAPTNFNEYPTSTMNRAIVNHALIQAGLSGKTIVMTSGLPVKHYYTHSGINKDLVLRKKQNLLSSSKGGEIQSLDGLVLPRIEKHSVIAEGIAAWVDLVVDIVDGKPKYNKELIKEKIGIVDIGGRTTDIAVIKDWSIDPERSQTIDAGMLSVHDEIRGLVKEKFGSEVDDEQIYNAITNNKIKVFGQEQDITDIVKIAKLEILGKINNEVKRKIGDGGDLTKILFVGGGSIVFKEQIEKWYPRNGVISEDPLYANAIGMMKCSMLMLA